jgi:hypothetical protein
MREILVAVLILSALALREAWLLIPESSATFDPFPYYNIQLTKQTYFYFAFYYGSNLILIYAFLQIVRRFNEFFHIWFVLQTVELIDYFLTYNTAWVEIGTISIGITLVKLVTLTITIFIKWQRSYFSKIQ